MGRILRPRDASAKQGPYRGRTRPAVPGFMPLVRPSMHVAGTGGGLGHRRLLGEEIQLVHHVLNTV